ncbi:DUF1194 domain-containing protein [Sedimenticola thiotaurini]|nr:DUF1194 domain-containing protein [Sedimenticola thiotaurini]
MKKLKKLWGALAALPLLFGATQVSAVPVDLELSLVIDVSGSVSTSEYNLMMDGYANAFRDATIQNNILSTANGDLGQIAVNVVFFASNFYTTALDTFTLLDSAAAINTFADTLDNFARPGGGGTDIFDGVNAATALLTADNGFESTNLIMDVSGDGTSTAFFTQAARDAAEAAGITINGITIGSQGINDFYIANVITSDGFALHATDFDDFSNGIKTKLVVETSGGDTSVPAPATLLLMGAGLLGFSATRRRKAS